MFIKNVVVVLYIFNRFLIVCVKAVLAGDYVISMASIALAQIGNTEVVKVLSQVLDDLVAGTIQLICTRMLPCACYRRVSE